jgi:hypothetical protein
VRRHPNQSLAGKSVSKLKPLVLRGDCPLSALLLLQVKPSDSGGDEGVPRHGRGAHNDALASRAHGETVKAASEALLRLDHLMGSKVVNLPLVIWRVRLSNRK